MRQVIAVFWWDYSRWRGARFMAGGEGALFCVQYFRATGTLSLRDVVRRMMAAFFLHALLSSGRGAVIEGCGAADDG